MSEWTQEERDAASCEETCGSALAASAASFPDQDAWEQLIELACQRNALRDALNSSLKAMEAARNVLIMYGGNKMPTQDAIIEQARAALAKCKETKC